MVQAISPIHLEDIMTDQSRATSPSSAHDIVPGRPPPSIDPFSRSQAMVERHLELGRINIHLRRDVPMAYRQTHAKPVWSQATNWIWKRKCPLLSGLLALNIVVLLRALSIWPWTVDWTLVIVSCFLPLMCYRFWVHRHNHQNAAGFNYVSGTPLTNNLHSPC